MTGAEKIAASILAGAALIASVLAFRPIPDRYTLSTQSGIRWFDTATGEVVRCREGQCVRLDRSGKRTEFTPDQE